MPRVSVSYSFPLKPRTCNIQESHETQATLTNDDLLGDKIPCDQEIAMRQFCYQTLKLPGGVFSISFLVSSVSRSLSFDTCALVSATTDLKLG